MAYLNSLVPSHYGSNYDVWYFIYIYIIYIHKNIEFHKYLKYCLKYTLKNIKDFEMSYE